MKVGSFKKCKSMITCAMKYFIYQQQLQNFLLKLTSYKPLAKGNRRFNTCSADSTVDKNGSQHIRKVRTTVKPIFTSLKNLILTKIHIKIYLC